jgi:hypothetical protein
VWKVKISKSFFMESENELEEEEEGGVGISFLIQLC